MRWLALASTVVAGIALGTSARAEGTTWYVDVHGTAPGTGTAFDPYTSIDYAVHQPTTESGDLVLVLPGVYEETVEIVNKGITVRGVAGATETLIDARGEGTVVTVIGTGDCYGYAPVLEGLTLINGTGTARNGRRIGGGVLAEGTYLTLRHCIVRENRAAVGGGIGATESYLNLYDCEIHLNAAATMCADADGHGGGLYIIDGSELEMTQVGVRWNTAALGGGIYAKSARVELHGGGLRENLATGLDFLDQVAAGGGAFMDQGDFWMEGTVVESNRATGREFDLPYGGGLYFGESAKALLEFVEFRGNLAADPVTRAFGMGGALASDSARVVGRDLQFFANWAGTAGGGVWGPVTLYDSVLEGNWAHSQGGGAWGANLFDSELTANEVRPLDDWGSTWGAGAYGGYLEHCILKDNVAYGYGGVVDPASFGGGAWGATVVRTQVFDNQADFGGGLAQCDIDVSTIFGNTAMAKDGGGGLFYLMRGGCVSNSIVWRNANGQIADLSPGVPVNHTDVQGGWPGVGNANWDPMFWDASARDFHLKPNSYCIDMGDPAAPVDPDGSRCDMGALIFNASYCGLPSSYCVAKTDSLGCVPNISFVGTPSLTGFDDFHITAGRISNQRNGILVWSYLAGDLPFMGGTLCVNTPLIRTPVQNSGGNSLPVQDCSGSFSHFFSQGEMGTRFMWAGRTFFAQFLYRDEGFPAPQNVGLTDGLRVTVCP